MQTDLIVNSAGYFLLFYKNMQHIKVFIPHKEIFKKKKSDFNEKFFQSITAIVCDLFFDRKSL